MSKLTIEVDLQQDNPNVHYVSKIPCRKRGHTLRYTKSGKCVECRREDWVNASEEKKQRQRSNFKKWANENKEYIKAKRKARWETTGK